VICPTCGASIGDNSQFCSNCGNSVLQMPTAAPPGAPPLYAGQPQTSGKAVASLVCGIINIFPLFIIAIVLGHIALSEIKKSAGRLKGEGLAIAGLVLGYLGIVAIPIILIIAAIAIPNLLRAKIAANEASAVGSVRNLLTAEVSYQATHESVGFTCNLADLSDLVGSELATGSRIGYSFSLKNCSAEVEGGPVSKFQITAVPRMPNSSGPRAFCADESGVIRTDERGSAEDCMDHGQPLE
jgi:type IV pilus assembly protein PilA